MSEAMTYKLPPLPEPTALGMDFDKGWDGIRAYGYTEDDMQAYAIAAIEAQGVPDGWQLVPKEPTQAMTKAAADAWLDCGSKLVLNKALSAVRAGIASAPPAPQAEIVEATQPHPTNNYLFKLLCEKAGIVLGVDRVDTACEKVARMSPCVDSKCPNYWDDAYDDLKPGDIEADCEPAPQEVVEHQSPESLGDSDKKEQPHKAAGSGLVQSLTTSQESVGGLRELYGDAYGETPPAPQANKTHVLVPLRMTRAMQDVVNEEDWSWADLLAAAEAVTEDEYAIAEEAEPVAPQASVVQQEPLGFISPKQVERIVDPDGEFGAYIPMRKTPAGNFTLAVYTHPAQQAKPLTREQKWEMWTNATIEHPSARGCYFRGVEDAEAKHGIKE